MITVIKDILQLPHNLLIRFNLDKTDLTHFIWASTIIIKVLFPSLIVSRGLVYF